MATSRSLLTTTYSLRPLRVLLICRVSSPGEGKQDIRSLDDQEALLRRWLDEHIDQPVEVTVIAGSGSGERLDRRETARAEELVESRQVDLVLAEDLGRIFRRNRALDFCELAEDHDCRVVAINDRVDTSQEGWRMSAGFAAMRHEMYNADTASRIRRTLRNRFSQGGVIQYVIYGYIKPPGAKLDSELHKDPAAEAIYREWFSRLEQGASYAEVADWLNEHSVPVGPYSRGTRWTAEMVSRISQNPILKGLRVRNKKISKRVNSTGRRTSIDAPPGERLERDCPHLAFIEPARFDRLQRLLRQRNAARSRVKNGFDPRKNQPRKRTVWPGQHLQCGVCGRLLHYTQTKGRSQLVCSGTKDYQCWNSVTIDAAANAQRLLSAILAEIEALPDFDAELRASVATEIAQFGDRQQGERRRIEAQQASLRTQIDNLVAAIGRMRGSESLESALRTAEFELAELADQFQRASRAAPPPLTLPTIDELRRQFRAALGELPSAGPEFGRLMHQLAPRIVVFPHQMLTSSRVVLRARVELNLGSQVADFAQLDSVAEHLRRTIVVDLFDWPQAAVHAERAAALSILGPGYQRERDIARQLGITQPAVQAAKKLWAEMQSQGVSDPYAPLAAPPTSHNKLRRHRHRRFRFEPLVGYPLAWPGQAQHAA
jgi:site-specific DNA recombinase